MNFRACIFAGLFFAVLIVAINVVAFSRASSDFESALDLERAMDRFAYGLSKLNIATSDYVFFAEPQSEPAWREAHDWLARFLIENISLFHRAGIAPNSLEVTLDHLAGHFDTLVALRSAPASQSSGDTLATLDEKNIITQLLAAHAEIHREAFYFDVRAEAVAEDALHNHLFTFIAVYAAFLVITAVGIFILYAVILEPLRSLDLAIDRVNRGDLSYRINATASFGFGRVCNAFNDMLDHRVMIERDLEQKAHMLAKSNAELENFAYVASHDLKAPLRGISNLVDWISTDLNGGMTETTTRHLDLLRGRATRMDALLDGLLQYSRAGRIEHQYEAVDTSRMIEEIGADIDPRSQFEISADAGLPVFPAERTPLEQVLRNLMSNAIKHHDEEKGRIAIDAEEGDTVYAFSVTDDGPGIPPRYHEKIFGMFQTLRPRDEVEGSGMGLALVKKVVEHHGGQIAVSSDPSVGRGTTFRFTWPKLEEADAR